MPRTSLALAIIAAVTFVMLSASVLAADPDPAVVKQVQDDVKLLRQGVFRVLSKSEIETALALMHPKIIEAVGGIEKARESATSESRRQATSLFTIEKVEFLQAPEFFSGKEHDFVFVPIAMTMSRVDRTRNQSHLLPGRPKKRGHRVEVCRGLEADPGQRLDLFRRLSRGQAVPTGLHASAQIGRLLSPRD